MKVGSLFSGIGGFDLALERAGCEMAWQVEIDPNCNKVLERHWPNVKRYSDVQEVGKTNLEPVDIITGGFPCQDLSVAGKRKGLAGERSGLWFEFHRIISELTPRWVVIENVPGLLSGCGCAGCARVVRILAVHSRWRRSHGSIRECDSCRAGRRFLKAHSGRNIAIIITGLVELGYRVSWRILDAQYSNLAQRRERVFIVASFGNGSCAAVLLESESVCWNPAPSREAGEGVAACLDGSPYADREAEESRLAMTLTSDIGINGNAPGRRREDDTNLIARPITSTCYKGHDEDTDTLVTHALRSEGADASEDGTGRGTPLVASPITDDNDAQANRLIVFDRQQLTSKENRSNPQSGDPSGSLGAEAPLIAFSAGQSASAGTVGASEFLSPTLKGAESGNRTPAISGAMGVRRLTPRECERLMGFPDDFTRYDSEGKEISDSARYRMLGNSIAVPCVEWFARRLISASSSTPA